MIPKNQEVLIIDNAVRTAFNEIGFAEFCRIIGQQEYWDGNTRNRYAEEKFDMFKQTIRGINYLGDFWPRIMDWCIEEMKMPPVNVRHHDEIEWVTTQKGDETHEHRFTTIKTFKRACFCGAQQSVADHQRAVPELGQL